MTKKRIADLLKEELEKPAAAGSETHQADGAKSRDRKRPSAQTTPAAEAKSATAKSATAKSTTAKSTTAKSATAKTATAKSASAASSAQKTPAGKAKPATTSASTAEFTDKIAELGAALNRSAEQISTLQADLSTHQSRIFELKDSLQKSERDRQQKDTALAKLSSELEEAKQTILKLTAAQAARQQEAKQSEQAKPESSTAKKPAEKPAEKSAEKPAARPSLSLRKPYSSYKSIPEYAIQRGTSDSGQINSMLSDDDIGWVD
jgi:chromosome segregation ATPase